MFGELDDQRGLLIPQRFKAVTVFCSTIEYSTINLPMGYRVAQLVYEKFHHLSKDLEIQDSSLDLEW